MIMKEPPDGDRFYAKRESGSSSCIIFAENVYTCSSSLAAIRVSGYLHYQLSIINYQFDKQQFGETEG